MALLVSVSDVIESMGMSPELEDDLDPAISRAIVVAQTRLETELDTELDRLLCKDTFHASSEMFSGVLPAGFLVLRLTNAFVATVVSVKASGTYNGEFSEILSSQYRFDTRSGVLYLDAGFDGQFVEIEYRSGFLSAATCPKDIKQAILYFVPLALKIAQPVDSEKKATANDTANIGTGIINALRRKRGIHFQPLYSESAASLT